MYKLFLMNFNRVSWIESFDDKQKFFDRYWEAMSDNQIAMVEVR